MTINTKVLTAAHKKANASQVDAQTAGAYTLKHHNAYAPAIKAYQVALADQAAVDAAARAILKQLYFEDSLVPPNLPGQKADPSWYTNMWADVNQAKATSAELQAGLQAVKDDLIANFHLVIAAPVPADPAAAAAALDAGMKANPRGNPNHADPGAQDSSLPPVDVPPTSSDGPPWTMIGLAAAAALLLFKIAR